MTIKLHELALAARRITNRETRWAVEGIISSAQTDATDTLISRGRRDELYSRLWEQFSVDALFNLIRHADSLGIPQSAVKWFASRGVQLQGA